MGGFVVETAIPFARVVAPLFVGEQGRAMPQAPDEIVPANAVPQADSEHRRRLRDEDDECGGGAWFAAQ